jgi:hypothetical protein
MIRGSGLRGLWEQAHPWVEGKIGETLRIVTRMCAPELEYQPVEQLAERAGANEHLRPERCKQVQRGCVGDAAARAVVRLAWRESNRASLARLHFE